MKILAIRLARLGDVILLLPSLAGLKIRFPGAHLTFLTGSPCADLARLCPAVDDVIAVDRLAMLDGPVLKAMADIASLVAEIRSRRFDLAIDFHGLRETNALTRVSGAPRRLGLRRFGQSYLPLCFNLPPVLEDKSLHASRIPAKVIERLAALPVSGSPIRIPEDARNWLRSAVPAGPLLALYLDAPTPERVWPVSRYAALAARLLDAHDDAVAVALAGPAGAGRVQDFLQQTAPMKRVCGFSNLPIAHVAALIDSARLLVSNDTGPMHLGPALGTPTLGLFSVGFPEHFEPTGPRDRFLRSNPIAGIGVDEVFSVAQQLWGN